MTRLALHAVRLMANGSVPFEFVRGLLAGKVHTVGFGIHNFMDAEQVAAADHDPVVKARLDSCVFKGAVKNRATNEWEAVPMCAMNQQRWSNLYDERLQDPVLLAEAQVPQPGTAAASVAPQPPVLVS